jgi:hypothetical protein
VRGRRPETDPGILRNRVALGYATLRAACDLDGRSVAERERWAVERGFLTPGSWLARRRLARLWREAFSEEDGLIAKRGLTWRGRWRR